MLRDDLFFWLLDGLDWDSATEKTSGILLELAELLEWAEGDLVGNDVSNAGRAAEFSTNVLFSEAIAAKLQSGFAAWKFLCILSLFIVVDYVVGDGEKHWDVRYVTFTSEI